MVGSEGPGDLAREETSMTPPGQIVRRGGRGGLANDSDKDRTGLGTPFKLKSAWGDSPNEREP